MNVLIKHAWEMVFQKKPWFTLPQTTIETMYILSYFVGT